MSRQSLGVCRPAATSALRTEIRRGVLPECNPNLPVKSSRQLND
jgi:hypothetical protein